MADLDLYAFNAQLEDFGKRVIPQAQVKLQTEIVVKLYHLLAVENMEMPRHPIETGWAQGNWRVSIVSYKTDTLRQRGDLIGPRTEPQLRAQLRTLKPFQVVWLFNNVPYMPELERGHSQMAPNGIVGPALFEIELFINSLGIP